MQSLDITITFIGGAYVTNTTRGQRTSCTSSAERAAHIQGRKLFGDAFTRCEQLHRISASTERWRLFASTEDESSHVADPMEAKRQ